MPQVIFQLTLLGDILLSAFLGFLVGLERKLRYKEAGIRTHTIVCVGATLMMIVSMYAFGEDADASRVAAQIVSGVGFLGAGIIVFKKHEVKGLTTAAGVWATAGVGMACGARMYVLSVGATLVLIAVQCILHLNVRPFKIKKSFLVNIKFGQNNEGSVKIKEIFGVSRFKHLCIERSGDILLYSATLNTSKELSSIELDTIMRENPFIFSIQRCNDE